MLLSVHGTSNPNSTETLEQEASNQPGTGTPRCGPHCQDPAPDMDACTVKSESYVTLAAGFLHPPPPRPSSKAGTTHSVHPDVITSPSAAHRWLLSPLAWPFLSLFRSWDRNTAQMEVLPGVSCEGQPRPGRPTPCLQTFLIAPSN